MHRRNNRPTVPAPMVELCGVRKCYGDLVAVAELSFCVNPGEVLALLGPNGAGKSTTIQMIVGLLEPDAGSITVDGHDVFREPAAARRAVGYLPESAALHVALTPREYLSLKGRLFGMDEGAIVAGIARLLGGFELADRADEPIGDLSKGMAQKVALAAALLTRPRVLVLDEPLSGLDVETTSVVKEVVRTFTRGGGAVLYSSHLLDVVETVADRVAMIDHGELVALGTIEELRARAGADGHAGLERVFQELTRASDPVARARRILGLDDDGAGGDDPGLIPTIPHADNPLDHR